MVDVENAVQMTRLTLAMPRHLTFIVIPIWS
jgi:hypothetical protein